MTKNGQLIVFEGADAAGKSAISVAVCEAIRKRGRAAETFGFPGNLPRTLGNLVYRIHHDPKALDVESLTPASLQALHIAAHLDAIETRILPLLERGTSVVLDRFWWSTFVYGVADGIDRRLLNALISAETLLWAERSPEILFLVTRNSPLRDEPAEKWRHWNKLYRELAQSEKGKYPISVIENETLLEAAIAKVLCLIH